MPTISTKAVVKAFAKSISKFFHVNAGYTSTCVKPEKIAAGPALKNSYREVMQGRAGTSYLSNALSE